MADEIGFVLFPFKLFYANIPAITAVIAMGRDERRMTRGRRDFFSTPTTTPGHEDSPYPVLVLLNIIHP